MVSGRARSDRARRVSSRHSFQCMVASLPALCCSASRSLAPGHRPATISARRMGMKYGISAIPIILRTQWATSGSIVHTPSRTTPAHRSRISLNPARDISAAMMPASNLEGPRCGVSHCVLIHVRSNYHAKCHVAQLYLRGPIWELEVMRAETPTVATKAHDVCQHLRKNVPQRCPLSNCFCVCYTMYCRGFFGHGEVVRSNDVVFEGWLICFQTANNPCHLNNTHHVQLSCTGLGLVPELASSPRHLSPGDELVCLDVDRGEPVTVSEQARDAGRWR